MCLKRRQCGEQRFLCSWSLGNLRQSLLLLRNWNEAEVDKRLHLVSCGKRCLLCEFSQKRHGFGEGTRPCNGPAQISSLKAGDYARAALHKKPFETVLHAAWVSHVCKEHKRVVSFVENKNNLNICV